MISLLVGATVQAFSMQGGDAVTWHAGASTPVHSEAGLIPIEQIEPGMFVWSRDEATGVEGLKPVLQTFITHPMEVHHLTYRTTGPPASGQTTDHHITATGTHPFWVCEKGKFIPASQLHPGDTFRTAAGGYATLIAAERITAAPGQTFTTYNFEVADWHTYHAGPLPLWVHNTGDHCSVLTTEFLRLLKEKGSSGDVPSFEKAKEFVDGLRARARSKGWEDHIPASTWDEAATTVYRSVPRGYAAHLSGGDGIIAEMNCHSLRRSG
jgi:Pretoxin HINT domain